MKTEVEIEAKLKQLGAPEMDDWPTATELLEWVLAPSPVEHVGAEAGRCDHVHDGWFNREKVFAEKWKETNNPPSFLNGGIGTLEWLTCTRHRQENKKSMPTFFGSDTEFYRHLTQEEATAAASAIQWLGTNCGWCWLEECMKADGVGMIAAERQRQVAVEGWTPEHDDEHILAELSRAASAYTILAARQVLNPATSSMGIGWPWNYDWWKPSSDPVRNLVKAGALIAAEIDRLKRAATQEQKPQEQKMKVFALNDCDWWAAETLEEAKVDFLEETGMDESDAFDDPHELDDEAMNHFQFHDEEDGTKRSFREQLENMIARGEKFPAFFASTEY